MADLSTATVDELAEELARREGLSFLLMTRLEAPVPEDEREAIYLSESFAEHPLTALHWMLQQVTAMVGSMLVPEGEGE